MVKFLVRNDGKTIMLTEMGNMLYDNDGNYYTKLGNNQVMDNHGNYYMRTGNNMVTNFTTGKTDFFITGLDEVSDNKKGGF